VTKVQGLPDFTTHPSLSLSRLVVWGEIQDAKSLEVVNHIIMELPSKHHQGLTFLKEPLHIDIAMVQAFKPFYKPLKKKYTIKELE
jgi:hypothetical protein